MNKPWKVVLAFVGVFVAGAVIGGVLTLRFAREYAREHRSMDHFEPMLMRRYAERLGLTDEQRGRVREIIRATEKELRRIRSEGAKAAVDEGEKLNATIEQILTPEQRGRLEELKAEMRARWNQDRRHRAIRGERPSGERPPPSPRSERP